MQRHTKSQYKGDGDFESLLERLLRPGKYSYKGKPKSLINSFIFFTENHPRHGKFFTKKTYLKRAENLKFRILEANQYPHNYIRANDRYGMLDVIEFFSSFSS